MSLFATVADGTLIAHRPLAEFLTIAGLHLLAVASPGPDFAVVLKQSIAHGRRPAIQTAIGVGCGIAVHVTYSLLGIGVLVKNSLTAFTVMKFAGAAYLTWIGVQALRAKPRTLDGTDVVSSPVGAGAGAGAAEVATPSPRAAWMSGFLTNALNLKATLFFVALFTVVISPQTPRWVQAGYGLWMVVATAAWFSLVAVFFTQARVRRAFGRMGHWFERAMGAILVALGIELAISASK